MKEELTEALKILHKLVGNKTDYRAGTIEDYICDGKRKLETALGWILAREAIQK